MDADLLTGKGVTMKRLTLVLVLVTAVGLLIPQHASFAESPPYDLRPVAEFEPHESMIIGWHSLGSYGPRADTMWALATEAILSSPAGVHVSVINSGCIAPIENFLTSMGVPLGNVDFLIYSGMYGCWVRDFGPLFVYTEDGDRIIVEGGYIPGYNQHIADVWDLEYYPVPLDGMFQGGNYMPDGSRQITVSEALVNNPANWQFTVRKYYDIPLHIATHLVDEETGHIDMWARFVSPDKVVVGQYDNPTHNANLDLAAAEFAAMGYEVFRVWQPPMISSLIPEDVFTEPWKAHLPPGSKAPSGDRWNVFRSYTNGIQCNGIYIMPTYNHPYDALALDVFQTAIPDHTIIPVNCTHIIQYLGALHCTSSDVPPDGLPRPAFLTVEAVGDDAMLSWPGVAGAATYEVFKRSTPYGFEEHLNDIVGFTTGTYWTDVDAFTVTDPVVYQVLAVGSDDVRTVLTPRFGGQSAVLSVTE